MELLLEHWSEIALVLSTKACRVSFLGAAWGEVTDYTMTRIKDNKESIPYTDDSAMTRAICKSLTEQQKYDNRNMAKAFVEEFFRDPDRGYGSAVGRVFERLRDEDPEDVTSPARSQFDGQGSYGNGAAMRISPLALFSRTSKELQEVRCKMTG